MKIEPIAMGEVSFSVVDSEGDTVFVKTWVIGPNHQEAIESFTDLFPDYPATYKPIVSPRENNKELI